MKLIPKMPWMPSQKQPQLYICKCKKCGFEQSYETGDFEGKLKGSTTGYWIHYSVLGMGTRNYGKEKLTLRQSPNAKSAAVYSFTKEIVLRPMDIKGDWVKVKTIDGKYTGWIEADWLCGNSLTNCC